MAREQRWVTWVAVGLSATTFVVSSAHAGALSEPDRARLLAAYPDFLKSIEGDVLIWSDGTHMPLDDGKGQKPIDVWLDDPDIEDMFAVPYTPGDMTAPPPKDIDPGRARNAALFDKMYGNCRTGEAEKNLVDVVWLPHRKGQHLKVTKINGVAQKLAAISAELDQLPASFDKYLVPSEGTYACRVIAGTTRVSAHGQGIAIDISTKHAHYWRWAKEGPDLKRPTAEKDAGTIVYRNEIPMEIVRIFEKHGFIWGGKWYHYDTMHFEYRPELLPPADAKNAK